MIAPCFLSKGQAWLCAFSLAVQPTPKGNRSPVPSFQWGGIKFRLFLMRPGSDARRELGSGWAHFSCRAGREVRRHTMMPISH